ncbi:hypothetical protein Pen01_53650 [Phytomonospora endophytica]|nr:hypothetical protein Pen01_53650 [Phytomonospora endophytica]
MEAGDGPRQGALAQVHLGFQVLHAHLPAVGRAVAAEDEEHLELTEAETVFGLERVLQDGRGDVNHPECRAPLLANLDIGESCHDQEINMSTH